MEKQARKESFKIKSKPELVASEIVTDIKEGNLSGSLPGYRQLMVRYSVSQITATSAIQLLESQGIVEPAKGGKRRKILVSQNSTRPKNKVLLLVRFNVKISSEAELLAIAECRRAWQTHQGEVIEIEIPVNTKRIRSLVRKTIEKCNPRAIATYVLPYDFNEAFFRTGIPCYFIGGVFPKDTPSAFASSGYNQMDATIVTLEKLREAGHSKILTPIHPINEVMLRYIEIGYKKVFPEMEPTTLESLTPKIKEDHPDVWQAYLYRQITAVKPTAIIVNRLSHLLAVYSFCSIHNLSIPRDLSVICESYEPEMDWLSPQPSTMKFSTQKLIRHFAKWAKSDMQWRTHPRFQIEWNKGLSIKQL